MRVLFKHIIQIFNHISAFHFVLGALVFLNVPFANTQDIHYTQFYANKLYLAPSFAGSTIQNRVGTNIRIQWPGLPKGYTTYCTSFDHYFSNFNSGMGLFIQRDVAGTGRLGTIQLAIQYSYDIQMNDFWHFRPGIQFGYLQRSIDYSKLILPYQLTPEGVIDPNGTVIFPEKDHIGAFDGGASVMFYSNKVWLGLSLDHLAKPNVSLMADEDRIPIKTSVFGGVTIIRNGRLLRPIDETLSLAFMFKNQADYRQLDLGLYWNKSPMVLGFWYRGLPVLNSKRGDMIAFLMGFKTQRFSFGYSYDFTISNLLDKSAGSHEISLSIEFSKVKRRKLHAVPCPEF